MSTVFALDELGVFARMGGLYIVLMGLARTVRALRVCQGAWPQNFGARRARHAPHSQFASDAYDLRSGTKLHVLRF